MISKPVQIAPSPGRKVGVFDVACGLLVTGSTDKTIQVFVMLNFYYCYAYIDFLSS